jgi:hypothetical protein
MELNNDFEEIGTSRFKAIQRGSGVRIADELALNRCPVSVRFLQNEMRSHTLAYERVTENKWG